MSNSAWNEPVVVVSGTPIAQPRRPQWPWEQPGRIKRSRDFLREYICERYLVRVFDETARYIRRYGVGYNFVREDEATFVVRASCLAPTNRAWVCNFGNTEADFILFFGFRDRENPVWNFVWFCLCRDLGTGTKSQSWTMGIILEDTGSFGLVMRSLPRCKQ